MNSSHDVTQDTHSHGHAEVEPTPRQRILLVDDEPSILASLRRLFRRESYEIFTANSGKEALQLLEQQPVPLVITDQRMPSMTGVELLREIRQRWPDTLRIVLSGYSEAGALIAAINEGDIYKFVSKPWNDEELKLHVRRALEQHELVAEKDRLTQEVVEQNRRLQELNERLDQRATDASTGLTCAQALFESADVGVLTIDETGLIVGANRQAEQILSPQRPGCTGLPASAALPDDLYREWAAANSDRVSGHFTSDEHRYQWRVRPLLDGDKKRGNVLTLWEQVA